jgi:hypothetical protein
MTDLLTERLHASAERIHAALRPAREVRQGAEHARRVRRVVGATLVAAVAIALGVGVGGHALSRLDPVTTPSPSPMPGVFTLAPDPFLTGVGWAGFWGPGGPTPVVRKDTQPAVMECVGDVHQLGATEVRSATYVLPGGGFNNEFVLRYDDEASATSAFADLQSQFARCHRQQKDPAFLIPDRGYVLVAPKGPIDDMFEGEGSTTSQDKAMGLTSGAYQVYAAREGNVVVAVESYEGWGDRTSVILKTLLDKALGPDWSTP